MKSSFLFRTRILFFCIFIFAVVLVTKLFFVQIVRGNSYSELADRQYYTPSSNIFERGTIYFQKKNGELHSAATQNLGYKVAINPAKLSNAAEAYRKISALLPLKEEDFMVKAGKTDDPYEEVATRLSRATADQISALSFPGVSVYKEKWRFYPGGSLAAQTLGFVGYKGDELSGRYGLERQYDNILRRDKDNPYVNFFAEVFSSINKKFLKNEIKQGDVVTTIEPEVQSFLEKELKGVEAKYNAERMGGIIMNPKTGVIYALGATPDFDLNNFSKVKNASVFGNPLVENVLEFGSVVKPLVMAAALDAGVVTAETTYNDAGSVVVEKKEIFNFDKKGRGPGTTMQKVLSESLNTGMVFVFQKLGRDKMRDYLFAYSIGDKTGIDLPNETSGLISNLNSPRNIEYANAAFGQGIALTPMELVRALASLGNGGNLVTPHLVEKIKYEDGTEKIMEYPVVRTKISEATSEEITRMLVKVMDEALRGGQAKLPHYSVAVKTGTAQVADNVSGGYYEDRHTHSFFGYFPAYDPQFIILLYAVNPQGVRYASETWADPFLRITKFLLNYYEVPPDR
ncbi:hypothetical protein A3G06_00490 [Candidatus Nomurabacteria bacterium RIFCSPLOWO2_12_FULL_46_14]|uniref:Penicillin-binding protein transpeptidase domain-containing protein n=1 Tax=Candidatus Nomurabacteria bacterium RIFCSPLOWO2_12_FULL_46_14 TaxID=1801797 RepID=A0A1F6YCW9_9BACT|nr:MAG: hypothetical protein A3G06_00490 [Candidatus Nomurabacteria bacterium RIFCSPLOWO2_12_FULL_46_14]